jgi:hypothetical protein
LNLAHADIAFDAHGAAIQRCAYMPQVPKHCIKVLRVPVNHRPRWTTPHLLIRLHQFELYFAKQEELEVCAFDLLTPGKWEGVLIPGSRCRNVRNVNHDCSDWRTAHFRGLTFEVRRPRRQAA